jgi:heptosyltransferase III
MREVIAMKKILVIRGGALGDFLIMLPTLRLLRERWPDARIELLGHPSLAEPAIGRFYLDAARSVNHGPLAAFFTPRAVLDPAWMDWFGGFDLVLSYFYDPDQLFETNLRRCQPGQMLTCSPRVPEVFREPAARHFARILRPLGLELGEEIGGGLFPSPGDLDAARAFLAGFDANARLIAIHPGSGGEHKTWPAENWAELGRRLAGRYPGVTLLLIEGEADAEPAQIVADGWQGLRVVRARLLPLAILGAVLRQAELYLGHDSGITHLAAAARRDLPVVALFGPTDPAVWAPPRAGVRALGSGARRVDHTVEAVEAAAVGLLEKGFASFH